MGIKVERVGSTCERCSNIASKELKVTHYTENDNDLLLCDNCILEKEKERLEKKKEIDEIIENDRIARERKCHKCNENVWSKGGVRKHEGEYYCKECVDKIQEKNEKTKKRNHFIKSNWRTWIFILIGIISLLIARELI